jgi:hypothetical protein
VSWLSRVAAWTAPVDISTCADVGLEILTDESVDNPDESG